MRFRLLPLSPPSIFVLFVGLSLSLMPSARAGQEFKLLTNWYAQAEQGGFYQAKATGLYEKAGLDVELEMGGPQLNLMQILLAGQVDAIMGYDFQVLQGVEKNLPVVAVAATFQYDFQGIMAHDNVKTLGDLKGKTILVSSAGRNTWWPWLATKFGYTEDQIKPYTFNLQPFFVDPNVVQSAYPSSEPFQALEKGVPVKFFLFSDDGYPPYGQVIVTTQKVIDSKSDALKAFVKASMAGWQSYIRNPGPANALIKAANRDMTDAQIAFGIEKMKELKVLDGGSTTPIGWMTEARWKASADYLVSAGLLRADADWRKAFNLDFVKGLTDKLN
jgi:NitT/TauT family transport system substrate-binding protein